MNTLHCNIMHSCSGSQEVFVFPVCLPPAKKHTHMLPVFCYRNRTLPCTERYTQDPCTVPESYLHPLPISPPPPTLFLPPSSQSFCLLAFIYFAEQMAHCFSTVVNRKRQAYAMRHHDNSVCAQRQLGVVFYKCGQTYTQTDNLTDRQTDGRTDR